LLERAAPTIALPLSSVSFDPVISAFIEGKTFSRRDVPTSAVLIDLFSEVFPPVFVVDGAIQASVAIDIDMNQESALRSHL
jgi:hypothetical protein